MEFLTALAEHAFLRHALVAGLLAAVACGVIGPFVVVRRIAFLAGGIAHAVLGGMGAAYYFGYSPVAGAAVAAVGAALLVGWIRRAAGAREDTLIGALWAAGMAVGLLFIARTPGYNADLMSYLLGGILAVRPALLGWMAALDLVIVVLVALYYRRLVAASFDGEFATLRGMPVAGLDLLLLVIVSLAVVLLIQVVGLILVMALLTLPAAAGGLWAATLGGMMAGALAVGAFSVVTGLAVSYATDLPAGATIVLTATAVYVASLGVRVLAARWRGRGAGKG